MERPCIHQRRGQADENVIIYEQTAWYMCVCLCVSLYVCVAGWINACDYGRGKELFLGRVLYCNIRACGSPSVTYTHYHVFITLQLYEPAIDVHAHTFHFYCVFMESRDHYPLPVVHYN